MSAQMRYFWLSPLALILLLWFAQGGLAKEECGILPNPPDKFHEMTLGAFGKFEDEKLGIGVTFSSENERLSLLKFDYGFEVIDDETVIDFARSAALDIFHVSELKGGEVINFKKITAKQFGDIQLHNFLLFTTYKGGLELEYLGLGHDGSCMVKIRYSYRFGSDPERSLQLYEKYIDELHQYYARK